MNFGLVMTILMKFNLGISVKTMAQWIFFRGPCQDIQLGRKIAIILMGCKPMISDKIFCILEEKSCAQNIWCYVKPVLWRYEEGQREGQESGEYGAQLLWLYRHNLPFLCTETCLSISCHSEHRLFTLLLWEKPTHKTMWCIIHFLT